MKLLDIFGKKHKKANNIVSQKGESSEEAILKKTAKSALNPQERMQAVAGITDQEFLYDIAVNDNDFGVSKAAVERLTEQEYLNAIGKDNAAHDWRCRKAAIVRMTDKEALQHIIDSEKELTINCAAKDRLNELS